MPETGIHEATNAILVLRAQEQGHHLGYNEDNNNFGVAALLTELQRTNIYTRCLYNNVRIERSKCSVITSPMLFDRHHLC